MLCSALLCVCKVICLFVMLFLKPTVLLDDGMSRTSKRSCVVRDNNKVQSAGTTNITTSSSSSSFSSHTIGDGVSELMDTNDFVEYINQRLPKKLGLMHGGVELDDVMMSGVKISCNGTSGGGLEDKWESDVKVMIGSDMAIMRYVICFT